MLPPRNKLAYILDGLRVSKVSFLGKLVVLRRALYELQVPKLAVCSHIFDLLLLRGDSIFDRSVLKFYRCFTACPLCHVTENYELT